MPQWWDKTKPNGDVWAKVDFLAIAAACGVVLTVYALWWSRDRASGIAQESVQARRLVAADRDAIILAMLFVLLGFLIALLVKRLAGVAGDLPFVLVVFLPIVVFLILSGKIANLTAGPTGLTLTLSLSQSQLPPVTNNEIGRGVAVVGTPPAEIPVCAEPEGFTNQASQQLAEPALQAEAKIWGAPVYLTLIMGGCHYSMDQIAAVLEENSYNDEFRFIVLVSETGIFQGYMDSLAAAELFSCEEYEDIGGPCDTWRYPGLIDAINDNAMDVIAQQFPQIVLDTVTADATNIAALKEMRKRGLDSLVVKYDSGHVKGVISQEQILGAMMVELASPSPG